jgi:two-component system CheB/CheR fusion protein
LNAELQKRLIPLFHYALNDGGFLFLGSSEGIGDFGDFFEAIDHKEKIYQRKNIAFHTRKSLNFNRNLSSSRALENSYSVRTSAVEKSIQSIKVSLRELTEQALLKHLAPASALVNTAGDILYLYGRTGMYLEPSPGESGVNNILRMARDGLRVSLSQTLRAAALKNENLHVPQLSVKTNGHFTSTDLSIYPLLTKPNEMPLFLIVFEEARALTTEKPPEAKLASDLQITSETSEEAQISALKLELRAKDEYLQSTNEELERSNEELKSSNEEMQSVNEELQSTNEELETSKEELQSVNEELATVNADLLTKVLDLSRLNNDMNNLLAGTGIATIFVDLNLLILRFTPSVSSIINVIAGDLGRPLLHIVHNLKHYSTLIADVQSVLKTLTPKAVELETIDGHWYEMRIRPYRTLENVIEGAVITFVDTTEIKAMKIALEELANRQLRLAIVVRDSNDAITVQNLAGDIIAWNPGAVKLYGWSEAEALQLNADALIPPALLQTELSKMIELSQTPFLQPYQTERLSKSGASIGIWMTASALINEQGRRYAIATTERALVTALE